MFRFSIICLIPSEYHQCCRVPADTRNISTDVRCSQRLLLSWLFEEQTIHAIESDLGAQVSDDQVKILLRRLPRKQMPISIQTALAADQLLPVQTNSKFGPSTHLEIGKQSDTRVPCPTPLLCAMPLHDAQSGALTIAEPSPLTFGFDEPSGTRTFVQKVPAPSKSCLSGSRLPCR